MEKTIKVISAYKGMFEYIKEAKTNPKADLKELWLSHVIEPYWDDWASGQFNEERTREQMQNPITELDMLSHSIELLNNIDISSIIVNAYKEITELLPPP